MPVNSSHSMRIEGEFLAHYSILYRHNRYDKLSFWFVVVYNRNISINAQANLSNFLIKNSFTSMDSKCSNDATDKHEEDHLANILMYCTTQLKKIPIKTLVSSQTRD